MKKLVSLSIFSAGLITSWASLTSIKGLAQSQNWQDSEARARHYAKIFDYKDTFQKATLPEVKGTIRFRTVLKGILYRAGRGENRSLSFRTLDNISKLGFSKANYVKNLKGVTVDPDGKVILSAPEQSLAPPIPYERHFAYRANEVKWMLAEMHRKILDAREGPILAHCYGGQHASGLTATYALIQFCGLNADQAVKYWEVHTDDPTVATASFDSERKSIRDFADPVRRLSRFKIAPGEFSIGEKDRMAICPRGSELILKNPAN